MAFWFLNRRLQPFTSQLLNAVLTKIGIQQSPERTTSSSVVHGSFIPCLSWPTLSFPGVARVIITTKQVLAGIYAAFLQGLVDILHNIAQNISNPNFDQCIFESMSDLIRFTGATAPDLIAVFEAVLFPSFTEILQNQYIPDGFQILAYLMMLNGGVLIYYCALLPSLLTLAMRAEKGSIPGLIVLLHAILACHNKAIVEANYQTSVLVSCSRGSS
ncbi:CAS/CSE protein [Lactarius quietus]|nr:CAS/CSE protein [Lactarius quietus]